MCVGEVWLECDLQLQNTFLEVQPGCFGKNSKAISSCSCVFLVDQFKVGFLICYLDTNIRKYGPVFDLDKGTMQKA